MSWPSGKYRLQHAASTNISDVSADSETWSDYVPVAVHSIPLESTARTGPHSPSLTSFPDNGVNQSQNDRDIENLAIEIAELQQMMDRVGSKVDFSPPARSPGSVASSGQAELREHAEMLHQYYVSTLGLSNSATPVTGDVMGHSVVSPNHPAEADASLLRQQLISAQSANNSLQKENAALAKLLAEHLPHLQQGQHQDPIEPTALDLPNSLKYSSAANTKASTSQPEPVPSTRFSTEDLTVLRNFVEQLDVDSLPVDLARASIEDATFCLTAINMELAAKLQQVGVFFSQNEDSWKPAALAAQSQNLELQGVIADLNKRVLDLTQALDKHQFQTSQNSAQVCYFAKFMSIM
jgi:hypothetical protein